MTSACSNTKQRFQKQRVKKLVLFFYHSIKIFHITGLLFKAEQSSHLPGVGLHSGDINLLSNNSQYIIVMAEDGSLPVNLSITQFSPMHNTYNFYQLLAHTFAILIFRLMPWEFLFLKSMIWNPSFQYLVSIFLVPSSDEKSYWEQLFYYYAEWSTYKNQIIILLGHV